MRGAVWRRDAGLRAGGCAALRPSLRERCALVALAAILLLTALVPAAARAQTPAGTVIDNTALATFDLGAVLGVTSPSNTVSITTTVRSSSSSASLLAYAPGAPGSTNLSVPATECSASGLDAGPFGPIPGPTEPGGAAIGVPGPIDLIDASTYPLAAALFIRLGDSDQNLDPAVFDTVNVRVSVAATGDSELLRLSETGANTGDFTGWVQSGAAAVPNDCALGTAAGATVSLSYTDPNDGSDGSSDSALIAPSSLAFDAASGGAVDGAAITLVDDASGLPAAAFGDDGVSVFPPTVPSGGTVSDSGGAVYAFGPGAYRFPLVPAGTYRLVVTPPATHLFPTASADPLLQSLPGAPFALVVGSRGEPFTLAFDSPVEIDLPLDPASEELFLAKTASRQEVGIGEVLQYEIRARNPGVADAPAGLLVTDRLPAAFRYREGSAQIDGVSVPDPNVSADGRTLTFTLGPVPALQNQFIRYVVEVTSGRPVGSATNRATSLVVGTAESHAATATVLVRDDLFSSESFLMGQVVVGSCDAQVTNDLDALAGVRVYLEDGTYAITDERGMYQFEGVAPGNHVVQMDVSSLPPQYAPVPCEQNTRFAGRAFSQFVDLQAGTLWRTDFHVALRPADRGYVNLEFLSRFRADEIDYHLDLNGSAVPLRNVSVVAALPEQVEYVRGSARLDGEPLGDPDIDGGMLTWRLGEAEGGWSRDLEFRARPAGPLAGGTRLEAKAFATFRTPTGGERTPIASNFVQAGSRGEASSGLLIVDTLGLRPGEVWERAGTAAAETSAAAPPVHDAVWLEGQDGALEWLRPPAGFRPPIAAVHVSIKHAPGDQIELHLNGEPVSSRNFEGQIRNAAKTALISRWRGVDLVEGINRFELRVGGETRLVRELHYAGPPTSAELVPERSRLTADGATPPLIAVRLRDRFGEPVRPGVTGELEVEPPYAAREKSRAFGARQLAGLDGRKPSYRVEDDGVALIELDPTAQSGRALLRLALIEGERAEIQAWLEPEQREWILVGIAEGSLGYNFVSDNAEAADDLGVEEHFASDERIALFARGRVLGRWLLTLAYDSRQRDEPMGDALQQVIDPDTYYTLYGSDSEQRYEAPTSEKLYVKIERSRFYAMFGDYETGFADTELARYSRSFTGLKTEWEGERFGFQAFATETDQGFIRDEIRGDGTSGLYRLTRSDLVLNSEKVTVETRDRFKTDRILSSEPKARHVDYEIDFAAGTLFFKSPIPSKDAELNPIFIVVEYESQDEGDQSVIAGGRGSVKLLDQRLKLGATALHEGTVGADGELLGVDLSFDPMPGLQLRAEAARSDTLLGGVESRGAAYVAELNAGTGRLDAGAYFRREDEGFGLGQQNASEIGMQKAGAEASLRIDDRTSVSADLYRQTNLESELDRDVLEGRADWSNGPLNLFGGLRFARDERENDSDAISRQLIGGGGYSLLNRRLRLTTTTEVSLGGGDESEDFPSRTTLGAEFDVTRELTAFAEHEFAFGDDLKAHGTRAGIRATPWTGGQVQGSLEQAISEYGPRTFANLGLTQAWKLNDRWSFDTGFDRVQTLDFPDGPRFNPDQPPTSGALDGDFTAIFFGSTYRAEKWSATGRVETSVGDREDRWSLRGGLVREVHAGLGYSAGVELIDSSPDSGSHRTEGDLRLGFVWRPMASRWLLLDRLDLAFEKERDGRFGFDNRKLINNLHLNWRWNRKLQVSLQYGAKYVLDDVDGERYAGYTDLSGIEIRRDLNESWDLSLAARVRSSWSAGVFEPSYGASIGYKIATNMWVSGGYNFAGFRDEDFSAGEYTVRGPFLRFRYKFDQQTVRDLLDREGFPF
jgi:uncharacterized repeat protein (TIGR01451 family)